VPNIFHRQHQLYFLSSSRIRLLHYALRAFCDASSIKQWPLVEDLARDVLDDGSCPRKQRYIFGSCVISRSCDASNTAICSTRETRHQVALENSSLFSTGTGTQHWYLVSLHGRWTSFKCPQRFSGSVESTMRPYGYWPKQTEMIPKL